MKKRSVMLGAALFALAAQVSAADSLRPEVGKPLQEAQTLLQSKQYKPALAKIGEAQDVGKLTPYESYIIERMRSAAASGAGDYATAIKSYDAVLASGQLPENEKVATLDTLARLTYASKDYGKAAEAIQKYKAAGGTSAVTVNLLPQALYLSNQFPAAQKELDAQIAQTEKAGQKPSEDTLKLLASIALKQNDTQGYVGALEKLVAYHPQPSYWLDLIVRSSNQPGFSDRLTLDVYRLRKATGTLDKAGDYMEAAQLALQAGFPGEAQQFVDDGYAAKLLGEGADASRHQRLKDLVVKKVAEDKATLAEGEKAAAAQASGDALVSTGLNSVGYGDYAKGIPLMEKGIAKGGLKNADEAALHLGYAQLRAGQKADAAKTFKAVPGSTGAASLAQLWLLAARAS